MLNKVRQNKLAIVCSYDELCGNATYAHALREEFSKIVDVDVLGLDLMSLQKKGAFVESIGDRHIKELASRLKHYDYVNIQFEAGLYGPRTDDIFRRFKILAEAAPNLVVTMHRLDPLFDSDRFFWSKRMVRVFSKKQRRKYRATRHQILYKNIIDLCKKLSKEKNAWICVHTQREKKIVKNWYGYDNCFDFPIAFLQDTTRKKVLALNDREAFLRRHNFTQRNKIIGVFGFLSAYKGTETAVAALAHLPDDYIVAIFGGQHPQSIRHNQTIDESVLSILELCGKSKHHDTRHENLKAFQGLHIRHSGKRVRFIGALPDDEFIEALHYCDAVALPYLETGQSMSGVLPLAIEAGARLFCANNLSFSESFRYYGRVCDTFDIGNSLELAQKILNSENNFTNQREIAYNKYNISELVKLFMSKYNNICVGVV
jgi:glycosyltransferase involved in cell wall biosynthesis